MENYHKITLVVFCYVHNELRSEQENKPTRSLTSDGLVGTHRWDINQARPRLPQ